MWWLLTYAAYALGASVLIGAAGYAAIKQLALLQRLLAVALERWLRQISANLDGTANGFGVWHTDEGVEVSGVALGTWVLSQVHAHGFQLAAASVQHVALGFPSLSRPLTLRLSGFRAHVQQVKLPKPPSIEEREDREQQQRDADKAARLAVVEQMLWGAAVAAGTGKAKGSALDRLSTRGLQKLLGFLLQYVQLEIRDVQLRYTQYGEPGPRPAANYLQGADAAVMHIRAIQLVPQGVSSAAGPAGVGAEGASAAPEGGGIGVGSAQVSGTLGDLPMQSAATTTLLAMADQGTAAPQAEQAAVGAGRAAAGEAAGSVGEEPFWRLLLRLPGALWGHIVTDRPSATCLSMTGVSLMLQTYPTTWPGYREAEQAAAGGIPGPPNTFAFSAGRSAGGNRRPGEAGADAALRKRRRPGGLTGSSGFDSQEAGAVQQPQREAAGPVLRWVSHARLLANAPVEEHIVFRQWEATIIISLLPPSHTAAAAGAAAAAAAAQVEPSAGSVYGTAAAAGTTQPPQTNGLSGAAAAAVAAAAASQDGDASGNGLQQDSPEQRVQFSRPSMNGVRLKQTPFERLRQQSSMEPVQEDVNELEFVDSADLDGLGGVYSASFEGSVPFSSLDSRRSRRRFGSLSSVPSNLGGPARASMGPQASHLYRLSTVMSEGVPAAPMSTADASTAAGTAAAAEAGLPPGSQAAPAPGAEEGWRKAEPAGTTADSLQEEDLMEESGEGPGTPGSSFLLDIAVALKALIPELNVASMGVLNRLLDRQLHFQHYGNYWEARPQVPVLAHASDWWRHAGSLVADEVRRVVRHQVPLEALPRRRRLRQEYQRLYAAAHVDAPGFHEPGRRWWHRRRVRKAAADDLRRLQGLEELLSVEEVAHFRYGVAAVHNARLAANPALQGLVVDKLDAVVYTQGPLSPTLQQRLLHLDQVQEAAPPGAAPASVPPLLALRLAFTCPKVGIALDMRPASAALPGEAGVPYLGLVVQGISCEVAPGGVLRALVSSLTVGRCAAPTAPMPSRVLASPSTVCHRVCKAAEFFRYAVSGTMLSPSAWRGVELQRRFVTLTVRPRAGQGGRTVVAPQPLTNGLGPGVVLEDLEWRPGGYDLDVQVAAISLTYEQQVFTAALRFLEAWEVCHSKPWSWASPQCPPPLAATAAAAAAAAMPPAAAAAFTAAGSTAGGAPSMASHVSGPPGPPSLPLWPSSVEDMVQHTLAVHGIPIAGTLTLPTTAISLMCPGIALELPYQHDVYLEQLRTGARAGAAGGSPLSPQPEPGREPQQRDGSGDGGGTRGGVGGQRGAPQPATPPGQLYMFVAAVQSIRLHVMGENAAKCLQSGASRRTDVSAFLDVFSYLSNKSRRAVAQHMTPSRGAFDTATQSFMGEAEAVDSLVDQLREVEIAAMAKVWAYPEDMPLIIQGIRSQDQRLQLSQSFKHRLDTMQAAQSRGLASNTTLNSMPSMARASGAGTGGVLRDSQFYPMPLVPFLKCGGSRANMVDQLCALPGEVGGAELAIAGYVLGIQVWLSPLHVWHLLSVAKSVKQALDFVRCSPALAEAVAADKESRPAPPSASIQSRKRKIFVSMGLGEVSMLWMIGTWTPKHAQQQQQQQQQPSGTAAGGGGGQGDGGPGGPSSGGRQPAATYRRSWGITVKRGDPAFIWAQWLAPVYSVGIANIDMALRQEGNGALAAGISVDGIIVRDLQLPEQARHAYVLRPLPARARRLNTSLNQLRRQLLGVANISPAKYRWYRAVQAVLLRLRTSNVQSMNRLLSERPAHDLSGADLASLTNVLYGGVLFGPQIRLRFRSDPAAHGRPPTSDVSAEVGQMLAYVRIKQQASMTAFVTQMTQITAALQRPSKASPAAAILAAQSPTAAAAAAAAEAPQAVPESCALKVRVTVVGIDVLFRVQSRDLLSLKLQQGKVFVEQRPITPASGPRDVRLYLSASVQDIMVQDLRASPEHSLVLIPNGGADYCSLSAAFTTYVDPARATPSLVLQLQNPRVLLLFRFITDILQAVDIITATAAKAHPKHRDGQPLQEGVPAAGAAGPAASGTPGADSTSPAVRTAAQAASSVKAATQGSEEGSDGADSGSSSGDDGGGSGLELVVQLQNVGLVVPTSAKSHNALGGHIGHLMVALPGSVLPTSVLDDCDLPSVEDMIEESLLSNRTYKFSGFHDTAGGSGGDAAAAPGTRPAAGRPAAAAGMAAAPGAGGAAAAGGAARLAGAGARDAAQQAQRGSMAPGSGPGAASAASAGLAIEKGGRLKATQKRIMGAAAAQQGRVGFSSRHGGKAGPLPKMSEGDEPGVLLITDHGELHPPKDINAGVLMYDPSAHPSAPATTAGSPLESPRGAGAPAGQRVVSVQRVGAAAGARPGAASGPDGAVLSVRTQGGRPAARPATRSEAMELAMSDSADLEERMLDVVGGAAQGMKSLVGLASASSSRHLTDRMNQAIVMERQPDEGGTVGGGSASKMGPPSLAQKAAAKAREASTLLTPLDEDAGDAAGESEEAEVLPEAFLTICVEQFQVFCGELKRMPQHLPYQKPATGPHRTNSRKGLAVPASLGTFCWPIEVWDMVEGGPFIYPTNLALSMFKRLDDGVNQLHFCTTPLTGIFNAPNFTGVMDFVEGNLEDLLHPPNEIKEPPKMPPQVRFNPDMKFGPRPDQHPSFRLTVAAPRLMVVLEANPEEWTAVNPTYSYAGPGERPLLRPFLRAMASNVLLDLGKMSDGELFMDICATSLDFQDLRPAYRLMSVTSQLAFQPTLEPGSVFADDLDPFPSSPGGYRRRQEQGDAVGQAADDGGSGQLATPRDSAAAAAGGDGGGGGVGVGNGDLQGNGGSPGEALVNSHSQQQRLQSNPSSLDAASSHASEEVTSPHVDPRLPAGPAGAAAVVRRSASRGRESIESIEFYPRPTLESSIAEEPSGYLDGLLEAQQLSRQPTATPMPGRWQGQGNTVGAQQQQQQPQAPLVPGGLGALAAAQARLHRRNNSLASRSSWREPSEYNDTPATPSTGLTFSFQPSPGSRLPAAAAAAAGGPAGTAAGPALGLATPGFPRFGGAGGAQGGEGGVGGGDHPRSRPSIIIPPPPDLDPRVNPHTGIKMSVARRLSEKADRKRQSMLLPALPATAAGPAAAAGPALPPAGAGGRASPTQPPQKYAAVIDTIPVPEMSRFMMDEDEEAAVIVALSTPHEPAPDEAPQSRREPGTEGANAQVKFEVGVALLNDSTTAIEIAISDALLNWPYFQDLSLVWSLGNLFGAPWSSQRPAADQEQRGPCYPPQKDPEAQQAGPAAWMYINVVATESQVFVPVYSVSMAQHLALQLWDFSASLHRSEFERVADLALACMLLDQVDGREGSLALEERGLAVSWTALRFAYAYGGDGESNIKVDLRDFAAFVRDPRARVNCVLLPFSARMDLDMRVPQAAEHSEVERLQRAALAIQRAWRLYCLRKALKAGRAGGAAGPTTSAAAIAAAAAAVAGMGGAGGAGADAPSLGPGMSFQRGAPRRLDSTLDSVDTFEGTMSIDPLAQIVSTHGRPWQLVDELVTDVASPHTRNLLQQYRKESQDRNQMMYLQRFRATSSTVLRLNAGELTLRAAFSHIHFWQTATDALNRVVLQTGGGGLGTPAPMECGDTAPKAAAQAADGQGKPGFRPSSLHVNASVQSATVVLCNDKPATFGAPDVLQASLADVDLAYDVTTLLHDRPPNQAAQLSLKSYASFLNSSTSRWEALYDVWPLKAEFVDIISPVYLSDRKTKVWLESEQHLDINFNPASLLSLGDALSFLRTLTDVTEHEPESYLLGAESDLAPLMGQDSTVGQPAGGTGGPAVAAAATTVGSGTASVMSRAPQKYLIQNQSGMKVYYWADAKDGTARSPVYCLENGGSENLRVAPAAKRMTFMNVSNAGTGSERLGSTINLHFEGNWMPIRDVSVNVVGKYRYRMTSPADNTWLPIIIDIILVGRTKIITLHSGIWVENGIERDVTLRLHIPTTPLVPPPGGLYLGNGRINDGDISIGPLKPSAGTYLPLTAVLGGSLFLRPVGFQEASRDVVRLSPHIPAMLAQQGYISCEPDLEGDETSPLHVALQAVPAKLVSEFQAFKHMECIVPGVLQRPSDPLEVQLSIQPTMVLFNSLPYEMRVLLWQVLPEARDASASPDAARSPRVTQVPATPFDLGTISPPPGLTYERASMTPGPRFGLASPLFSAPSRRASPGRFFMYTIKPGASQDIYADLRQNVLLHVSVEEIGMRSTRWALLSTGARPRYEGGVEVQYTQKLPKDIPLRMVGVGMSMPASEEGITRYLGKLKDAALHLRTLHLQFHHETKVAMNKADIAAAVGRVRMFAQRMGKASARGLLSLRPGRRRARAQAQQQPSSRRSSRSTAAASSRRASGIQSPRASMAGRPPGSAVTAAAAAGAKAGGALIAAAARPAGTPQSVQLAGQQRPASGGTLSSPFETSIRPSPFSAGSLSPAATAPGATAAAAAAAGPRWSPPAPLRTNGVRPAGAVEIQEVQPGHLVVSQTPRASPAGATARAFAAGADAEVEISLSPGGAAAQQGAAVGSGAGTPRSAAGASVGGSPAALRSPNAHSNASAGASDAPILAGHGATSSVVQSPARPAPVGVIGVPSAAREATEQGPALLPPLPLGTAAALPPQGGVRKGGRGRRLGFRGFGCFDLRRRRSGAAGPPPAPSAGAGGAAAGSAEVAAGPDSARTVTFSVAGATSTAPTSAAASPSVDSRAGLLVGGKRRSDWPGSTSTAGGEVLATPSAAGRSRLGSSVDGDGMPVVLEAVPELADSARSSGAHRYLQLRTHSTEPAEAPTVLATTPAAAAAAELPPLPRTPASEERERARAAVKAVFDSWRDYAANRRARRVARESQGPPDEEAGEEDKVEEDSLSSGESTRGDGLEEDVQVRSPPVLYLGLFNSLEEKAAESQSGAMRITLYAPYWLNNRTGVDLFYKDKASAPNQALLFGAALPWDFGEVFTPGTSMTETLAREDTEDSTSAQLWANTSIAGETEATVLEYRLVLMNNQKHIQLGLSHVPARQFAPGVQITTVGNKGTVELKGPANHDVHVNDTVLNGLRGMAVAGVRAPVTVAQRIMEHTATHTPGRSGRPATSQAQDDEATAQTFPAVVPSAAELSLGSPPASGWGGAGPGGGASPEAWLRSVQPPSVTGPSATGPTRPEDQQPAAELGAPAPAPAAAVATAEGVAPLQLPAGTAAPDQGVAGGSGEAAAPQAAGGAVSHPLARESAPAGNLAGSEAGRSGTMAAQGAALRRSLRRLSSFDVNKTEPGTMLVRVRSGRGGEEGGTPTFRRTHRRTGSNLSALGAFARERAAVPDEEVEAAAELMRQLTPQASGEVGGGAGGSGEQPPPAREQLSEAVDQGSVLLASAALREEAAEEDRPPVTALSAPAAIAPLPGEAQASSTAAPAAGGGAGGSAAAGAPPEAAAVPSLRAAAPTAADAGTAGAAPAAADLERRESEEDIMQSNPTMIVEAMRLASATDASGSKGSGSPLPDPRRMSVAGVASPPKGLGKLPLRRKRQTPEEAEAEVEAAATAAGLPPTQAAMLAKHDTGTEEHLASFGKKKRVRKALGQRLYEFAVDVAAGPPDSIFRHTKLVTLKPKYIIENQTGLPMAVKQLAGPDPVPEGTIELTHRFACVLLPNQRAAVYWDDSELPRELVIKPVALGEEMDWHWSGGFPIPETEWYFGLRIRHRENSRRYINIPVNVTVGSSGSVQVTLKSPNSVPPYRIENMCKDVVLYFIQVPLVFRRSSKLYVDNLQPGEVMPYAWDEPTMLNKIRVQAKVSQKYGESRIADYALDHLGDQALLLLPTHGGGAGMSEKRRLYRTLSTDLPDELKQKLVSLLAAEYSKKVYVTVYADGPTRVLRFSDEKNVSSLEQQHVILDLAARLKQVETQLRDVNARFARLYGMSGAHALDLYGRTNLQRTVAQAPAQQGAGRRPGKRLPISSSAQALVKMASSRLALGSLPPSQTGSPRPVSRLGTLGRGSGPAANYFTAGLSHGPGRPASFPPSRPSPQQAQQAAEGPDSGADSFIAPRASTVRFDVALDGVPGGGAGGESSSLPVGLGLGREPGGQLAGVLEVMPEQQQQQQQAGLLPRAGRVLRRSLTEGNHLQYRRQLSIDTGAAAGSSFTGGRQPGSGSGGGVAKRHSLPRPSSADEIQPASGDHAGPLGMGFVRRIPSSSQKDYGHITGGMGGGAGSGRSLHKIAASARMPTMGRQPSTSSHHIPGKLQRRQELLRGMTDGDAVLLIGGDLTVTVEQAQGLYGSGKYTHPFARITVMEPFKGTVNQLGDERSKQTTVVWQSTDPVWDEQLMFRDVCAASELVVELWDLGGSRSSNQLQKLSDDPQGVIKSCRFLGRAEVPLSETLDVPAGTPLWFQLMRRGAADNVSGQLQLRFLWDVTAKGLLSIKLHALERVLQQRQEILAALQPVPAAAAIGWREPPDPGADNGTNRPWLGVQEVPMIGAEWATKPSPVAAEVLMRHAHDYNRRHLVVTVLEARGLAPRRGVVVALSASELPNPQVTLSLPGYPDFATPVLQHNLTPRWEADQEHVFRRVDPGEAALMVRLWDDRGGGNLLKERRQLVGEGVMHAAHIKGESPVYVWVPLSRKRKRKKVAPEDEEEVPDLQVYLRLQWQTELIRGASVKLEVDMAGVGLLVMGGLQDELFNLTLDSIRWTAVRSRLELTVEGSVHKVQLDNQMLDAVQPVVLAPAAEFRPTGTLRSVEGPLITFNFVRSFAGSGSAEEEGGLKEVGGPHCSLGIGRNCDSGGGGGEDGSEAPSVHSGHTTSVTTLRGSTGDDKQGIKSFKDIRLTVGSLDLMTDEAFLEALLSFMSSIPTEDVWQDKPWREQQRRLLSAQFGPKEVERLAVNEMVPLPGEEDSTTGALDWVVARETKTLELLHGQSDLSSWYFIESAEVSGIEINVTVSLTSRLLSGGFGHQGPSTSTTTATGAFNRTLGASGFQLVNVGNVPIVLGRWMVGNDPSIRGRFSNGFLSQKALMNNLTRHYTREALKEAHKVLGGAGPAVAAVPLTVLWASGNVYSLVRSLVGGTTGPVAALQQVIYVPLMAFSMISSGFSRMLAALLAFLPPGRAGGDEATVQRIIKRPNNALEALARVPVEIVLGFWDGLSGLLLDPMAGYRTGGWGGLTLGLVKAGVGLLGRPGVGILEAISKLLHALALTALGREGIIGKIQRRVKAPGAFAEDEAGEGLEERMQSEAQLNLRALMAAWQRVLPEFFPAMAKDTVTDVINVRPTRVLLVTDNHVAYLRARHLRRHSIYKAKWLVPISEMQNLAGNAETLKISITHVHKYDLWVLGVWPVQKRKGLRCVSRTVYERTVAKLSRLLQQSKSGQADGDGERLFVAPSMAQLTILNGPYQPPQAALPPPQGQSMALVPAKQG